MSKILSLLAWGVGIVFVLLFLATRKFYLGGSWGFVDSRTDEAMPHEVDRHTLIEVLERFLVSDSFDILWVSRINDEQSGLVLTLEGGIPIGTLFFNTKSDAEQIADLAYYLAAAGYEVSQDSNGFNGGWREEHRQTCVEFAIGKDVDSIESAMDCVLGRLQPTSEDVFYVNASRTSDHGEGIKLGLVSDPLADLASRENRE